MYRDVPYRTLPLPFVGVRRMAVGVWIGQNVVLVLFEVVLVLEVGTRLVEVDGVEVDEEEVAGDMRHILRRASGGLNT